MADIHLAGETLDDVEPDREHDIDHDQIEQILLVAVADRQREQEQSKERGPPAIPRMRRGQARRNLNPAGFRGARLPSRH